MICIAAQAQKVEAGTRIINCSDMPAGSYTTVKRRCPVPDHFITDRLNQTIYIRFEVAEHNYQNSSQNTSREMAKSLCSMYKESAHDRGTWRLPTQRELALMWILRPALAKQEATSGFIAMDSENVSLSSYYSATSGGGVGFAVEPGSTKPYLSQMAGSIMISDGGNNVRCVRDLDIN